MHQGCGVIGHEEHFQPFQLGLHLGNLLGADIGFADNTLEVIDGATLETVVIHHFRIVKGLLQGPKTHLHP